MAVKFWSGNEFNEGDGQQNFAQVEGSEEKRLKGQWEGNYNNQDEKKQKLG